jgi:hypothetical protein
MGNSVGTGLLLLALAVGAGCSSQERDVDAAGLGGVDTGPGIVIIDSGTADDGSGSHVTCTAPPEDQSIPAGTCPTVVTHCDALPNDCSGTGLRGAVGSDVLAQCGIWCGAADVGFSGGCATTLGFTYGFDAMTASCLLDVLTQSRFDCVPADGWMLLSFGSCTLP